MLGTLSNPVIFSLSDVSKTYEREVYTFMEALGDFGGFNDGIILFPAIFMQIYSQKMYLHHLFKLLPIKRNKDSSDKRKIKYRFSEDQ